jgi:hypothetical protein
MKHVNKMILVPEDQFKNRSASVTKQSDDKPPLDKQIDEFQTELLKILNNASLSVEDRYDLYMQLFSRYMTLVQLRRRPMEVSVQNEIISPSNKHETIKILEAEPQPQIFYRPEPEPIKVIEEPSNTSLPRFVEQHPEESNRPSKKRKIINNTVNGDELKHKVRVYEQEPDLPIDLQLSSKKGKKHHERRDGKHRVKHLQKPKLPNPTKIPLPSTQPSLPALADISKLSLPSTEKHRLALPSTLKIQQPSTGHSLTTNGRLVPAISKDMNEEPRYYVEFDDDDDDDEDYKSMARLLAPKPKLALKTSLPSFALPANKPLLALPAPKTTTKRKRSEDDNDLEIRKYGPLSRRVRISKKPRTIHYENLYE